MKESIFLFALLASSIAAHCQSPEKITIPDSVKNLYLRKAYEMHSYGIFFDETTNTVESCIDGRFDFFLKDIDTLLIFDGKYCGGLEKGVVNVYKFSNGEPKTILSRSGKIARTFQ
jgi:hypothetical protein